ncbi:aldehyde dehydrogenase family protein [Povalibacter sp.]|uniref:aldehyde dehydrogenase family protein n=1 Tax=Povalibacter sp. TaxID=1962978 RepID=UPI002F42546A
MYKLTYSTMFDPPAEMHTRFEAALQDVRAQMGGRHALFIDGADVHAGQHREKRSPIDRDWLLGSFPQATADDVDRAMQAAHKALPSWRATPVAERTRLLRRVAQLIEERVYHIGAALALEVGKNRMEALGETQETADFFNVYCDDFERQGFDHVLPNDPLPDTVSRNRSVMKPYGAWVVITPFNFPFALAGGPVAAALVTGNTVVLKSASDTPWSGRLLADCLRDAGIPAGVFNYLSGPSTAIGDALLQHPHLAGITFTGSYDVGMRIARQMSAGRYPRPVIAEMGGKNACIVTAKADLERAAAGIVRSAYGMGGQKCSALSRLYVESVVADELSQRLQAKIAAIGIGDPTRAENWFGPVVNETAYRKYAGYTQQLRSRGAKILAGGKVLAEGDYAKGFFVTPTLAEAAPDDPLWREEMFLPILTMQRVRDLDAGLSLANDSDLGLTAGMYGSNEEVQYFFDRIEAGVTYANRPQGATTGAWPGYQPFGGWKGSGNTGKAIASFYYLAQYMREQSQTLVE